MGDALSTLALDSFSDELQKVAQGELFHRIGQKILQGGIQKPLKMGLRALGRAGKGARSALGGTGELVDRLSHPIEGLRTGWRESSPLPALARRAKEMGYKSPQEAAALLKLDPKKYKELMAGGGEHLLALDPTAGRARSIAERLSRSGWTGAGKATKYLPVGNKGLTVGFTAMGIPGIVNAPNATPTGEGARAEMGLGEAAMGLGTLLSAGSSIGMIPATAMIMGGREVGSRLGRVIDRVRSGASVRDAVSAPSPTEAAGQLAQIQKYYG